MLKTCDFDVGGKEITSYTPQFRRYLEQERKALEAHSISTNSPFTNWMAYLGAHADKIMEYYLKQHKLVYGAKRGSIQLGRNYKCIGSGIVVRAINMLNCKLNDSSKE